jgi:hypothetical protein
MSNKTIQKLPKWFKGIVYDEGETVVNKFTNVEVELNAVELSLYDFIMGMQWVFEVAPKTVTSKQIDDFHKALRWFQKNNINAYMDLLD